LFAKYPHRVLPVLRRRYGDVVALRLSKAARMVLLADPADIKAVFSGDSRVFHAGEANGILRPIVGEESVVVLDEEQHHPYGGC
jgi:cytochrome P450